MRINKKIVIGMFVIVSLFLGYSYYHYFIKIIHSFHQTLIQDVVISQDIAGAEVISNDLGSVMLNSGDVIIVSASGSLSLAVSGRIILYGVQKNKGLYRIPLVYEYDGTQSNINAATDWGLGVIMGLIKFGDHLLFPHRIINSYSSLSLIGDDVVFSSGAIFSIQSSPRFLRLKDEIRSQLGGLGSCSGDGCETYERMIARLFYESHLIIQSMIYPSEFVNKPYDLFGFSGYIVPFDYIAPFDYSGFSSQSSWIVIKSAQNGTKVNYDILSKDPITLDSKKSWLEKYMQLLNL